MLKLTLVVAIAFVADGVIYDGQCPLKNDFKMHKNFSCPKYFDTKIGFKILGHLPASNSSLNLFHNPMGAINDLEIQLMCAHYAHGNILLNEPETVKFFMACNDTGHKDSKYQFGCNYKSINATTHSWDVITYENCVPPSFWNSVNIVNYVKNLYAVLWGCRNLPNNKHEQGAWILGNKINFTDASKFLDQALFVDLNFAKASIKDFVLHNQTFTGNITACSHKLCNNLMLCKNENSDDDDDDDEEMNDD